MTADPPTAGQLAAFLTRWQHAGGSERANYQLFITELCALLGVPLPDPARDDTRDNAYVFERRIVFSHGDGNTSNGFIDCYRRGAFVLEAKKIRDGVEKAGAGSRSFDEAMLRARSQAENYARALPAAEGRPPLVIVVDVGHVIEMYAEFSRSGATYTPFPDVTSHRIRLDALCDDSPAGAALRDRLRAAWLDPLALDPGRASARVTRDVSVLLAELARSLEDAGHAPHSVSAFLSRCLFCMFAEDVGLLPCDADGQGAFIGLLAKWGGDPATLAPMLRALWTTMDAGGFSPVVATTLLRFNGKLFKGGADPDYVLPLDRDQIELLQRAARANWREVEPAIFGTLLERALDPAERHALGAHYTPRAYVERLVLPTVVEPLRADWADAQAAALLLVHEAEALDGKKRDTKLAEARAELKRFHHQLCTTRVLDPACGSGNFLYVTLEHLKRLEAEVLDQLTALGETQAALGFEGETVTLQQLLGIELNERAAALAELVLWIGWLQWQIRSFGDKAVAEPVVHDYGNIECRDAVLAWDSREYAYDAAGRLITRWDSDSFKPHHVTGESVPDETARVPQWRYVNPRRAEWPQADFIVGNPPFIGKLKVREALGDGYVEALRTSWPEVPDSADFVMYWWQRAAEAVRGNESRRMGFITTNSLTMIFNRRVVDAALSGMGNAGGGGPPGHLVFAIPDHPWVDSAEGAAVRISMTVLEAGSGEGLLSVVTAESAAEHDQRDVVLQERRGVIHADLRVGADVSAALTLHANQRLSNTGYILGGRGFVLAKDEAHSISEDANCARLIFPLFNGLDITGTCRNNFVIDAHGLTAEELREQAPAIWQVLHDRVLPERRVNSDPRVRMHWWLFRRSNEQLRESSKELSRLIVTCETSKHRVFSFVDAGCRPEHTLVVVAVSDAICLGVLSTVVHGAWALASGGTLEDRPRYNKTRCFETFPFPDDDTGLTLELADRIRALAEQIDAHRKARQAAHATVTLTGLYNVLAKLRTGETLTAKDKAVHADGLVGVLQSLHDDLDAAVLAAYGWSDLVPVPWADGAAREAWTETLLERLVALNARRAAEEAQGRIRWLRPDFQDPARRVAGAPAAVQAEVDLSDSAGSVANPGDGVVVATSAPTPKPWPTDSREQLRSVSALLAASPGGLTEAAIAARFKARGQWRLRLPAVLATLEAVARARRDGDVWRSA